MKVRLLKPGKRTAKENMAIDEAVLEEIAAGKSLPTLRLYGWSPPAVSIGFFQSLEEEVDDAACRQLGIEIVRRMTGGGAVLHENEVTYSIHLPKKSDAVPNGILESYKVICGGIVKGLAAAGLGARFVPINDIVVNCSGAPRKISGNAQTRKQGVILQHGTVLTKVDVEKMFTVLKVPNEKMKGKLIADIRERVTSLSAALGREVGFDEAVSLLERGFITAFPMLEFECGELSNLEQARARSLMEEKYGADSWNNKR